jgi:hypothetical protein
MHCLKHALKATYAAEGFGRQPDLLPKEFDKAPRAQANAIDGF